jgi:hypothetical protein
LAANIALSAYLAKMEMDMHAPPEVCLHASSKHRGETYCTAATNGVNRI